MQGNNRTRNAEEDELPAFLKDSPFLPVWKDSGVTSARPKVPKAPKASAASAAQFLRSKPARLMYGVVVFFFIVSRLRSAHVYERVTGPSCYFRDPVAPHDSWKSHIKNLPWGDYAYALYATDAEYLCNAVMIFDDLRQYGSKADRLLLYADNINVEGGDTREAKLLSKAEKELGVRLKPVKVLHKKSAAYSGPNWADSYTKLLAFNQTEYRRIITLDSDSLLLGSLDELFFSPPAAAVMPHAYWLSKPMLSSHIMVLTPSTSSFHRVQHVTELKAGYGFHDMEVMNQAFGSTCLVLPHEPYALLTGELKRTDHAAFLGSRPKPGRVWDADQTLRQAKFVHFSDSPLPKPWLATDEKIMAAKPDCLFDAQLGQQCKEQQIWLDLYRRFREKRSSMCA